MPVILKMEMPYGFSFSDRGYLSQNKKIIVVLFRFHSEHNK